MGTLTVLDTQNESFCDDVIIKLFSLLTIKRNKNNNGWEINNDNFLSLNFVYLVMPEKVKTKKEINNIQKSNGFII